MIHLSWIDALDLLEEIFKDVRLSPAVLEEVLAAPDGTLGLSQIRAALNRGSLHVEAVSDLRPAPVRSLGKGEIESIALAEVIQADLLITDDADARAEAQRRGIVVTGTLGVLRSARERGLTEAELPLLIELR